MKILFASSEVSPFAKTGGLADVSYSLPKALKRQGNDVSVITPLYRTTIDKGYEFENIIDLKVDHLGKTVNVEIMRASAFNDFNALFVRYDPYFDRETLYGKEDAEFNDNLFRFALFTRAILELIASLEDKPDVIHLNDWHTGLFMPYYKEYYQRRIGQIRTIFTIHNLGYQGRYKIGMFKKLNLPDRYLKKDYLGEDGTFAIIKGGLMCDAVNTVSPTYAREITTPDFGYGIEDDLKRIENKLYGIANGIDYDLWNPATDKEIPANYSRDDFSPKRRVCKPQLQKEVGLEVRDDALLCGMVSRLAKQKGVDLLIEMFLDGIPDDTQFVVLGTGEQKYHRSLRDITLANKGRISVIIDFNLPLARRIYAGSDVFLIPSLYEPCGLSQMIAMAYGTPPIARKTGGLNDTIIGITRPEDILENKATGFLFSRYDFKSLRSTIEIARDIFSDRDMWQKLVINCFEQNFSWDVSANLYLELYKEQG